MKTNLKAAFITGILGVVGAISAAFIGNGIGQKSTLSQVQPTMSSVTGDNNQVTINDVNEFISELHSDYVLLQDTNSKINTELQTTKQNYEDLKSKNEQLKVDYNKLEEDYNNLLKSTENLSGKQEIVIPTTGTTVDFLSECPMYDGDGDGEEPKTVDNLMMSGKRYKGIFLGTLGTSYALFNLEGKYESITFVLGKVDDSNFNKGTINFYVDKELVCTIEKEPDDLAEEVTVELKHGQQLKVEILSESQGWPTNYGMGNIMAVKTE